MTATISGVPHVAIRPRRLFVSGGSKLTAGAARLWRELGRVLAAEPGLTVITGGLRGRKDVPRSLTADWCIVEGMLGALSDPSSPIEDHIETVLPDDDKDFNKLLRFEQGFVRKLRNRTPQSRRFFMVNSADVIISIEGEHGTRSVLDLAAAIDKPILPLPFGHGASRDSWHDLRDEIVDRFHLSTDQVSMLEQIDLASLGEAGTRDLATSIKSILLNGFTRNCFVMMPFKDMDAVYDDAIKPALATHGLNPVRTDRLGLTGSVVETIRNALINCYLAIADTTDDKPNVMYELGIAHAAGKPVVLLRRADSSGALPPVPFDIQGESILKYADDLGHLRARLEEVIAVVLGRTLDENPLPGRSA